MSATTDQHRAFDDGAVHARRSPEDFLPPGVLWESWSANGEACVDGLLRPHLGCNRLAHCLMWLAHGYASRCRRTFDGTGTLVFVYRGPRTLTTMALGMSLWFDLALQNPAVIRDHLRHRGCKSAPSVTPMFWLEGATHEYLVRGCPIPQDRVPRQKLIVLAEEQQVRVPATTGPLRTVTSRRWSTSIEALGAIDEESAARAIATREDEHGYLANILVLVHEQSGRTPRSRPALEESWRRHTDLIAQLAPVAESSHLPILWHALWRLPSGMSWAGEDGRRWMRYPAVSFTVAARPIGCEAGAFGHPEGRES